MYCTKGFEISVIESSSGFYIGTLTRDGQRKCRLSKFYFMTREDAQKAIVAMHFDQLINPHNLTCSNGRPCLGVFEHDVGIFKYNKYFAGQDYSGEKSFYFKNEAAFLAGEGTCYIPELYFQGSNSLNSEDGKIFSYADLLEEVNGNEESCKWLFYNRLTWAIPNTDIEELDKSGLMMCGTCGAFVGTEEQHHCHESVNEVAKEDEIKILTLYGLVESLLPEETFREVMGNVLTGEIDNDGESSVDKMHRIVERYLAAEPPERDLIDDLVMTFCGRTVRSLLETAVWQYTGIRSPNT